jgi:hypothetical protein
MAFSTYPGPRTTLRQPAEPAPSSASSSNAGSGQTPSPEAWLRFRVAFVSALRDFPDAYEAVLAAVRNCESYTIPDPG